MAYFQSLTYDDIRRPSGRRPVKDFISELPLKAQSQIIRKMDFLAKYGLNKTIRNDDAKKISNKPVLYELRILFNKVKYRILFVIENSVAWFLEGFKKTTQKTPAKHIKNAIDRIQYIPKG